MAHNFNPSSIRLIIGLGNPGNEYKNTYHNVGFVALELLAGAKIDSFQTPSKNPSFAYTRAQKVYLIAPRTFMNESGSAVTSALAHFKVHPSEILIIHDDTDITLGEYKLQFGRGHAGHNGIKSIIASLKTNMFWRLRVGVRLETKNAPRIPASALVLKKISKLHASLLQKTLHKTFKELGVFETL